MTPFIERSLDSAWSRWDWLRLYIKHHIKDLRWIGLLCVLTACYQAWSAEHNQVNEVLNGKDGKVEAWNKFNHCDAELGSKKSLLDTYSSQVTRQQSMLDSEQGTINTCVVALAKSSIPEPQRYITFRYAPDLKKASRVLQLIVTTNKIKSPVNLMLECETDFTEYDTEIVRGQGETEIAQAQVRPDGKRGTIHIASPPWTPINPLMITVYSNHSELNSCKITPL